MRRPALSQAVLKEFVTYDPLTGVFTANKAWGSRPAGRVAGGLNKYGHRQIAVAGRTYSAQQLAWLYVTGEWCEHDIDHINRIRDDNRFENLRPLTRSKNLHNTGPTPRSVSGVRGVYRNSEPNTKKPWRAGICVDGQRRHLGNFGTVEEAAAARAAAEEALLHSS